MRARIIASCLLVLVVPIGRAQEPTEPTHDGRPLSEWLDLLWGGTARQRVQAVKAMGQIKEQKESIQALIEALADPNTEVRDEAAAVLRKAGVDPYPTAALRLNDPDPEVRARAVHAMGNAIDAAKVVPQLVELLKDDAASVRLRAAVALVRFGESGRAVPVLIDQLKTPDLDGRGLAIKTLAKAGEKTRVVPALTAALLDEDDDVRREAAYALRDLGETDAAVPVLVAAFKGENTRDAALHALYWFGEQAVPKLAAALRDGEVHVRRGAVDALGKIREKKISVPALIAVLNDGAVRIAAVQALGAIGEVQRFDIPTFLEDREKDRAVAERRAAEQAIITALIPVLADRDPAARRAAAEALAPIPGAGRAAPAFLDRLTDDDAGVRRAALTGLGRSRAVKRSVPAVVRALGDADPTVRDAAVRVLVRVGSTAVPTLVEALTAAVTIEARLAAASALGQIQGAAAVSALIRALADKNAEVQDAAVAALTEIGHPAAGALLVALKGADVGLRRRAAEALGAIRNPRSRVLPALMAALADTDAGVRVAAAAALGGMWQETRSIPALTGALRDPEPTVRAAAALALISFDKHRQTLPALLAAVKDADDRVAAAASRALAYCREEKTVIPILVEALKGKNRARSRAAAEALSIIGFAAVPTLIDALKHSNPNVRADAALAFLLVEWGGVNFAFLSGLLNEEDTPIREREGREDARRMTSLARRALKDALSDADEQVRQLAATALRRLDRDAAARAGVP